MLSSSHTIITQPQNRDFVFNKVYFFFLSINTTNIATSEIT